MRRVLWSFVAYAFVVGLLHLEPVEDAAMAVLNSEFVERWWG